MYGSRTALLAAVFVLLASNPSGAQQTLDNSTESVRSIEKARAALAHGETVLDVTLAGRARRIAGAEDETGVAKLTALSSGETRMDLTFSSGQHSEVRNNSAKGPNAKWIGPDGTQHSVAYHNLLVDSSWFFPGLLLQKMNSTPNAVLAHQGTESRYERTVEHIVASRQFSALHLPTNVAQLLQHASEMHIYIDSVTSLPSALTFFTHPDNNILQDIPVEIRFSDYREVNGHQIPFHVQKFLNQSLVLDLQFDGVTLNTGLSAAHFQFQ